MKVGTRVVLVGYIERYPIGIWKPGITGTVAWSGPEGGDVIGEVKLDVHCEALNEWENNLQVMRPDAEYGEVGWLDWQVLES